MLREQSRNVARIASWVKARNRTCVNDATVMFFSQKMDLEDEILVLVCTVISCSMKFSVSGVLMIGSLCHMMLKILQAALMIVKHTKASRCHSRIAVMRCKFHCN